MAKKTKIKKKATTQALAKATSKPAKKAKAAKTEKKAKVVSEKKPKEPKERKDSLHASEDDEAVLVNFKVRRSDKERMQKKAELYCDGKLSVWLRRAALEHKPPKKDAA